MQKRLSLSAAVFFAFMSKFAAQHIMIPDPVRRSNKLKENFDMNYSPGAQRTVQKQPPCDLSTAMTPLPENPVVAMAYVPFQTDSTTFDEMQALACGTLFPSLNKPFLGSGAR